ncbi:MAG TPA: tetratricopeptide repeat protein, partial [Longimicrobiales bacterium]|nr:tetratricopeptide repeat protein [Longimicrobiales bacterium]
MNRLKIAGTLALALSLMGLGTTPVEAQEGDRYTILVPYLAPQAGADDGFGEDVAKELREFINDLHTHQTVSNDDLKDARKKYDVDEDDLRNCITARQLAMQENWQLVVCGEYRDVGNDQMEVSARFVGAANAEEFVVPTFTVGKRDREQAARQMLESFDRWQTALRHSVFCNDYIQSEQWDQALGQCEQALAINPNATGTLYQKAFILNNLDRQDEALATLDQLLEQDQIHENALKLAGIVATTMGDRERAREYFDRYMELNPGDTQVRLTIATDISNAGDPRGALRFAELGLEAEPDNLNLITYIGHFAANAAGEAESAGAGADPALVTE